MSGIAARPEDLAIDFIGSFKEDCELRGMSPMTIERYVSSVRSLKRYVESEELDLLNTENKLLLGYLNHLRRERGLKQRTIENDFAAISSFYEFLQFKGYADKNPVISIRKRYLRNYKDNDEGQVRRLITLEEMARLINSTVNIRDKAIIALLAKTGIRRNELITLDVKDVDFVEQKIVLKPTPKRTNRIVFFDDETALILHRWMRARESRNKKGSPALFINAKGSRMMRHAVHDVVVNAAMSIGLHNPNSDRMEEHFSPHCCRHWFTTHLRRAGMSREFIQELRGDVRREAIDIYDHIDKKELRESYLAHIPQLGI